MTEPTTSLQPGLNPSCSSIIRQRTSLIQSHVSNASFSAPSISTLSRSIEQTCTSFINVLRVIARTLTPGPSRVTNPHSLKCGDSLTLISPSRFQRARIRLDVPRKHCKIGRLRFNCDYLSIRIFLCEKYRSHTYIGASVQNCSR